MYDAYWRYLRLFVNKHKFIDFVKQFIDCFNGHAVTI